MVLIAVLNMFNTFSLGTVLRFLYSYMGTAFRAYIPTTLLRKISLREKVLRYGRLPPSVLRSCVGELNQWKHNEEQELCIALDCENGIHVADLELSNWVDNKDVVVVVDERREIDTSHCIRAHGLCTGFVHYDAISLIYALMVKYFRRVAHEEPMRCRAFRDLIYLVRKLRESIQVLGSDRLIDPTTLVSVLNKRVRDRGLRAELRTMIIEKNWSAETLEQIIYLDVYALRDLSYLCTLRAVFRNGHELEIEIPIDRTCKVVDVCIANLDSAEIRADVSDEYSKFFETLQE